MKENGWAESEHFMTTALTYLRVSSTKQLRPDLGPEGLSIPAQRAACEATARKLGVTIIEEYVEPGRSGTTITARPALQSLLDRAANDSGVDHVIVYDLSRLARNRADDVAIVTQLAANGVKLISTAENIDETPVGQLTHGLLAAVNEYRSARDGVDISYKMRRKAEQGGTLGQAPIGYINTIERRGGRDIRGIEIDPKRCPLVREAFTLFATNQYGYRELAALMHKKGLASRYGDQDRPMTATSMSRLLQRRYYLGFTHYYGTERRGTHLPLVDEQLFEAVQAVIIKRQAGDQRWRRRPHYLKGLGLLHG